MTNYAIPLKKSEHQEEKVFRVGEFIDFLNEILIPNRVTVQGEVGKDIYAQDRYSIFYLLDKKEKAVLKCFAWQSKLSDSAIELREGLEIKVLGFPQIYKARGEISLEVEQVGLIGEGDLKRAFEILKKKLAEAGFFATERKKPIPRFVRKIGLITSQYGKGALLDFLKHLGNYGFRIYFYDTRVEGLTAIEDITKGIRWFNENMPTIDVLVLIRGGGSWESLQSFNSEQVAKAVFASKIPIICGIGHEKDETIADYVADFRASTPTHAARVISDPWKFAESQIMIFQRDIATTFKKLFKNKSENVERLKEVLEDSFRIELAKGERKIEEIKRNLILKFESFFKEFEKIEAGLLSKFQIFQLLIKTRYSKVKMVENILAENFSQWLRALKSKIKNKKEVLSLFNPEQRLKQGYSIVFDRVSKKIIKNVEQLKVGDKTKTRFYQGTAFSSVEEITKNN